MQAYNKKIMAIITLLRAIIVNRFKAGARVKAALETTVGGAGVRDRKTDSFWHRFKNFENNQSAGAFGINKNRTSQNNF